MEKDAYNLVYDSSDAAVNAMLLKRGELVFVITEKHYFTVKGENIVFGAAEVLAGLKGNTVENRSLRVYSKKGAEITKIPNSNLRRFISLYNIGFNITKFIAECVRKSNQILQTINENLIMGNNASRRYYKFYYNIISRIRDNAREKNNPAVDEFLKEKEETLAYRKGKLFSDISDTEIGIEGRRIDEFTREFPAGAMICQQNQEADDLYILNNGRIKVLLDKKEISVISQAGTIFGEMSLFLNEPRSATLIAAEPSTVTIINRSSLKSVAEKMPDFFLRISITLWERFKSNINMIREFANLNTEKARLDLQILSEELMQLYKAEKVAWVLKYREEISNAL